MTKFNIQLYAITECRKLFSVIHFPPFIVHLLYYVEYFHIQNHVTCSRFYTISSIGENFGVNNLLWMADNDNSDAHQKCTMLHRAHCTNSQLLLCKWRLVVFCFLEHFLVCFRCCSSFSVAGKRVHFWIFCIFVHRC